jgi:DNA polymerase elongation subunit (family B)
MEYQIYDFIEENEVINESDEDDIGKYIIHIFGRTEEGESVYCKLTGYEPYFYIGFPDIFKKSEIKRGIYIIEKWLLSSENRKVWKKYKNCLSSVTFCKKKKCEGFTNGKEFYFAKLSFTNSEAMKKFSYLFDNNELTILGFCSKPTKFKIYESNILPMLKCFHERKISGCSWVSCDSYKQVKKSTNKKSLCNIEITCDWEDIEPIKKDFNAKFIIASFDIECYSHDGAFPLASRKLDCVIQIGITYTRLGESLPFRRWIACLDKTDSIDDVIVESYENEDELMDGFINEINNNDCDIITGYNIFYFDEKYIYDRCDEILKMKADISCISKIKNKRCNFKEMKLASSALGENLLRYWETPGRVHVDLMKEVQKTFMLGSYKLDSVASHFIRGEVLEFKKLDNNIFELTCASVSDVYEKDFIHLEVIKGFVSDDVGDKYIVDKIDKENKKIYVIGDEILDAELEISKHGGNIFWSQAKDDVTPKDIFRMQKEGSKERAIVAKYCIKDCSLVNLLINKLEIITKNIAMSNVCFVPLSYLSTRGQGIKLFSLTLKEFSHQGYIFPVIKKKEIQEDSYEGAIVFDPVPNIYYEALATHDYMSLYPSSIIHKNMSHETELLSSEYDNIEGITYFNAKFCESDGTIKYVRYAKNGDKLGIIPTILDNLLKERKAVKNLMKNEKDQFKYKILDAQQLALKTTANSLYGQLGAGTSPIANRNIAACTTSTGREMLLFAKKYDEEILPWLVNGLKQAYSKEKLDRVEKFYDLELKARSDKKLIEKIENFSRNVLSDQIIQPVVRYGDTDSAFCCYRFRDNVEELSKSDSKILLKEIIRFGYLLIEPFFKEDDRDLLSSDYEEYFAEHTSLILPDPFECEPIPDNDEVVLENHIRIKQFLREYFYENYFSWLWGLQESIQKNFNNMENKLFGWSRYLIERYKFDYNDLEVKRKDEVVGILEDVLKSFYKKDDTLLWYEVSDSKIIEFIFKVKEIFEGENIKNDTDLKKNVKNLLHNTLKEEWDHTIEFHDPEATMEKRKLKRARKFNCKTLEQIIVNFVESTLRLNFKKYKIEHENKLKYFIENTLKDNWIYPWWDVKEDKLKYKIKFYKGGQIVSDKRSLENSIELGILSGEMVKSRLPFPHNLEYEKTFWPFLILTKKRYVGNKYEFNANKFKQDFMGIVLKRRDNAPIVKEICSGIINYLINLHDPEGAKKFIIDCLENMFQENYDIKYFLQSRTLKLKDSYKDWTKIPHVVLAERLAERDSGNKPQSGDRLMFAVTVPQNLEKKEKLLQGDMIEIPSYIKENNIPINYIFYMKNQIMNPVLQFLELVDKNAKDIFVKMEEKYGKKKVSKKKISKKKSEKVSEKPLLFNDILKSKGIGSDNETDKPKKANKPKKTKTKS